MGIDATKKGPSEGYQRVWPDVLQMSEDVDRMVKDKWRRFGL